MSAAAVTWDGRVILSITRALYVGKSLDTSLHAHHAIQVSVALEVPFALRVHEETEWREYDAAIIASNVPHQLDGRGAPHALLYLEPESADGKRISRARSGNGIEELGPAIIDEVRRAVQRAQHREPSAAEARRLLADVFSGLNLAPLSRSTLDERIAKVVRDLRENPNRYGSLPEFAIEAGLSPSRFRHLFTSEMGVSCRQYLLWLRLYSAVRELGNGSSVTDAAHAVGFADAAYLTRTFRRMFGIVPSAISRSVHLVSDVPE